MIKQAPWVALVAAALLLAACEQGDKTAQQETGTTTAGQATGTGGETQLTDAEEELIAELAALQTKVDELQQQAAHKTAETQAALVQELNSLQQEREELKQKVDELSDTGATVAANVLNGLNQSLTILTRSVEMEPEEEMPMPESTSPADAPNP